MRKKIIRKIKSPKRTDRFYGLVKVTDKTKTTWVSKQDKFGWSLGLDFSTHTAWLRNVRFKTIEEVKHFVNGGKTVAFLHMKGDESDE